MTLLMALALAKAAALFVVAVVVIAHRQQIAEFILAVFTDPDQPTVLCSYCKGTPTVIRRGNPDLPISHGLCQSCRARLDREMTERHERRRLSALVNSGHRGDAA